MFPRRRGAAGANGESRAEIGVGVVVAPGIDSHAGRTVGEHSRGDAESRNGLCGAGGTGHTLGMSAYHAIVGCRCNYFLNLFLKKWKKEGNLKIMMYLYPHK